MHLSPEKQKMAISSTLFRCFFLASLSFTAFVSTSEQSTTPSYKYELLHSWNISFPDNDMPLTISNAISPLTHHQINLFLDQVFNDSLETHSTALCKQAQLRCDSLVFEKDGGHTPSFDFEKDLPLSYKRRGHPPVFQFEKDLPLSYKRRGHPPVYEFEKDLPLSYKRRGHPPVFEFEKDLPLSYKRRGHPPSLVQHIGEGIFMREKQLAKGQSFIMHKDVDVEVPFTKFLPNSLASLTYIQNLFPRDEFCEKSVHSEANDNMQCVSSVEALIQYLSLHLVSKKTSILTSKGWNASLIVVDDVQQYIARESTVLSCHQRPFYFMKLYCHNAAQVMIYSVTTAKNELRFAVCHRNTTYWSPNHPAFNYLGVKKGETEVCHWLPSSTITWVKSSDVIKLG